ncbi:sigma-54-dependent transcriptional regulator [Prosthecochloris sp. CIB 2401]|uniref:sigma-54-dependent transcriptional regulator n=1 Tax=Prosthecochloris sp. CIB 2401 TaxID=1868325 RepID=UPI00080A9ECC|nr:sigma-54 dependent transcriptional regulator [Prosthecochloris sp. CIB 2401]ANT64468.1 Transcriptional regulatory protein ZraR [Prosthecochloris sp. CIB 2401]
MNGTQLQTQTAEKLEQRRKYKVLIADDESSSRILLTHFIKKLGYDPVETSDGNQCIEQLSSKDIDILLLDIFMPEKDGFQVMEWLQNNDIHIPVIMVTAANDIPQTVKCIKMGAFEYLTKPLDTERLQIVLRNAVAEYELQGKVRQLKKELQAKEIFHRIIGKSETLRQALDQVLQVMDTDLNVLILGESGTGKELFAQAIHNGSARKNGPFVSVNCAAISHELSDSILFGHAKGSFTGANSDHAGFFEQADGGTIFLDEIGDMDSDVQAKVLRAIQERKIRRVGEKKERKVDFRIVSATNLDFSKAIHENLFREDLYYRLEEFPIIIPPLRQRPDDIPLLATHFLNEFCSANNLNPAVFTGKALEEIRNYPWKGNVRELKNAVQRSALLHKNATEIDHVISIGHGKTSNQPVQSPTGTAEALQANNGRILPLEELERQAIMQAMDTCGGNPTKTAKALGIGRATLYRKLKKFMKEDGS